MSNAVFKLILIAILAMASTARAADLVYMGLGEKRDGYHTDLLTEVLKHSGNSQRQIHRYEKPLPHHRAFRFLEENLYVDIVIGYATEERDEKFRAIPIPLLKGINGWRISVVHEDNIDMFKNIKTLRKFKQYQPGQFHSWTDYSILVANGIKPVQGSDFLGLYHMLNKKRFGYLPRSVLEIEQEVNSLKKDYQFNIAIEPHMMISYPTAFYLYVNKDNHALASELNSGLEAIIANGIFDKIFYQYYGDVIEEVEAQKRRVFVLENPLLPKSVPLDRKELWLYH